MPISSVGTNSAGRLQRQDQVDGLTRSYAAGEIFRGRSAHGVAAIEFDFVVGVPGAGARISYPPGFVEIGIEVERCAIRISFGDQLRPVAG